MADSQIADAIHNVIVERLLAQAEAAFLMAGFTQENIESGRHIIRAKISEAVSIPFTVQ